ncbi:MAG: hypothetical protein O2928_15215 [Proteobacteria bacterium]|nr:hypothetical protein [Bacteroidota bacterium]MDA1255820.1 hypothetical protein [Pseudomonadota bacterium]
METVKKLIYIIGLCAFIMSSCKDNNILEKKDRLNSSDSLFERAKIFLQHNGKENYEVLNGKIQVEWNILNSPILPLKPSIWLFRNGGEMVKITDVDPNEVNGMITVDLAKFSFQHMDLFQICFVQYANGKKWIDSLNSPILLYDDLKTPVVSQMTANEIAKSSMKLSFKIIKIGTQPISELGICYNGMGAPTVTDLKYSFNAPFIEGQSLSANISNLTAGRLYYFRVFVKNQNGITYGNINTVQTAPASKPVVDIPQISNIAGSTLDISSMITDDGGSTITERGFVYNKTGNPGISDNRTIVTTTGNGISAQIKGLDALSKYYFSAFATNISGTTLSSASMATTSLPDKVCQISQKTTGSNFTIQIPSKSYYKSGETITVTMNSPTFKFGQASTIRLYDGDNQLSSFGNWLVFSNNSRDLVLPSTLSASNCYNIQVLDNAGSVYVTGKFTIIP